MKHYTRSGLGDSDQYYEGTEEEPLQGGGQGNAGAGPTWTCISIILILIIEKFWVGSIFVSALTLVIAPLTAIMYVDDTNLFLTEDPRTTYQELGWRGNLIMKKWCNTLWVTGGCLRPDKCIWYLIHFRWDSGGNWRYRKNI